MDDYELLVQTLLADVETDECAKPRVFGNKGIDHARVVVSALMRNAESRVCIFAHEMSKDVYDPKVVRDFLTEHSNVNLSIVVENDKAINSPSSALPELLDLVRMRRISVRVAGTQTAKSNVVVADSKNVRIEKSQKTREAIVSLGDRKLGQFAQDFFDQLWDAGKEVDTSVATRS